MSQVSEFRRALHQIPEVGFDLPQTSAYLAAALEKTGARLEWLKPAGLVAYFDAGQKETYAYRADMDALPRREETGAPYASRHSGCMHACGHDGHMAVLLALAQALTRATLTRNILLIFQPAEEVGAGAASVVATGVLTRYRVSRIYALHVMPGYPEGALVGKPGPMMSQSCEIHPRFTGRSVHIAQWQNGADALYAATLYVNALYRRIEALEPAGFRLLRFGQLTAGTVTNVLADHAALSGTLRAFDDTLFWRMREASQAVAERVAEATKVQIDLSFGALYPVLCNDAALWLEARETLTDETFVELPEPSLISEDFGYYLQEVPGVLFWMGLGDVPPLHAATFDFDDTLLERAISVFFRLSGAKADHIPTDVGIDVY